MPNITGLQLLPHDAEASLVNISPTGLLAESSARLLVGSSVKIVFQGGFLPATVGGRVARCEVAAMGRDGLLRYHLAIEFDDALALDAAVKEVPPPPVSAKVTNRW
jgi:hypothetical protein